MKLYLHLYANSFGLQNAFIWHGRDDDNAYFHFLTQVRRRQLDYNSYESSLDVTAVVAPLFVSMKTLINLAAPAMKIFIALAKYGEYILPAIMIAETPKEANRAYLNFAKHSEIEPTLLLIRDVTDPFKELIRTNETQLDLSMKRALSTPLHSYPKAS